MKTLILAAALAIAPGLVAAEEATRTPQHEVQWADSGFGPMLSPVHGDMTAGAHVTLIRFTAGMVAPVHTHEHDYTGIVLTGTTRHYLPDRPETQTLLPAGSHWFMPGGLPHVSECLPGAECIMALYQDAPLDIVMVE